MSLFQYFVGRDIEVPVAEAAVLLNAFLAYPTVYSLYSLGQPVNTGAYDGVYSDDNVDMVCKGMIQSLLSAEIFFWYIPISLFFVMLRPSGWWAPLLIAPHGLFFSAVITTRCPTNRIVNFQALALSMNTPWNSTNFFIPTAIEQQWTSTIVFTSLGSLLIFMFMNYRENLVARFTATFVRFVGGIMFAVSNPSIKKLFDEPVDRLCRRGNQNPDRVFDTFDTHFGPMVGGSMLGLSMAIAVLAFVSMVIKVFLFSKDQDSESKSFTFDTKSIVATLLDLASYIISAVLLAQLLYVQKNPGCNNGIEAVWSNVGRIGITLLSIAFIVGPILTKSSTMRNYAPIPYTY